MHRDMNSKKGIVLLFACVFLAIAAQCAEKEEPASPEALIFKGALAGGGLGRRNTTNVDESGTPGL